MTRCRGRLEPGFVRVFVSACVTGAGVGVLATLFRWAVDHLQAAIAAGIRSLFPFGRVGGLDREYRAPGRHCALDGEAFRPGSRGQRHSRG
jgi:hypothetical protein